MSFGRAMYVALGPKKGSKMQSPKFEQHSAITSKGYEIGCQLGLIITNRKSHMGFRLVQTYKHTDIGDLEWPWMVSKLSFLLKSQYDCWSILMHYQEDNGDSHWYLLHVNFINWPTNAYDRVWILIITSVAM